MTIAPDGIEPVSAWRSWLVEGDEPRLRSVVLRETWQPRRPMVAGCWERAWVGGFARHDAPSRLCRCGIHAARDPAAAACYLDAPSRRPLSGAIGQVSLWGSVLEGERGWRASHAYPTRLYLPLRDDGPSALRALEDLAWELTAYLVPVEILDCVGRSVATALGARMPEPHVVAM